MSATITQSLLDEIVGIIVTNTVGGTDDFPSINVAGVIGDLSDLASSPASGERVKATHRHKNRGSDYVLIGYGNMQAATWLDGVDEDARLVDMREVAIYRSVDDGTLWVRPREEFEDGRFVALSALGEHP